MRFVVKNNNIFYLLLITYLISCNENNVNNTFYFDLTGNNSLEKITIENNKLKYVKDIYITEEGSKKRILSIFPLVDSTFVLSNPKIENIYLEANSIQNNDKGLRIIIRNTDLIPDYYFIDIKT